jgi:energy-coupling factor transport system permease protein
VLLGIWIVVLRVVFRVVFAGGEGATVILSLPEVPLPEWAAGISLFGDVSAEAILSGLYDGLRLATMVICLGAANALANPKRLLKALPPALYEVGTAVIVALSVFPQLAESVERVRRARRLRGTGRPGVHLLRTVAIPVLEDALDRSLLLAASMDGRGYGRSGAAGRVARWATGVMVVGGLGGMCVGIYATLDGTTPRVLAGPVLLAGVAVAAVGFHLAGRRVERVLYRPDHWGVAEVLTAASGVTVAVVMFATAEVDPANLNPSLNPLRWPEVAWLPLLGVLVGLVPGVATPLPASPYSSMADEDDVDVDAEHPRPSALSVLR